MRCDGLGCLFTFWLLHAREDDKAIRGAPVTPHESWLFLAQMGRLALPDAKSCLTP